MANKKKLLVVLIVIAAILAFYAYLAFAQAVIIYEVRTQTVTQTIVEVAFQGFISPMFLAV